MSVMKLVSKRAIQKNPATVLKKLIALLVRKKLITTQEARSLRESDD